MDGEENLLKCSCAHCGGHLEFPASTSGTIITCPHCGVETELEDSSSDENSEKRFSTTFLVVGLLVALGAAVFLWKKWQAKETNIPPVISQTNSVSGTNTAKKLVVPKEKNNSDLKAGPVSLDRKNESTLMHALGTIVNDSEYQRFGVKVELDLLDARGARVGTATDYKSVLEPHQSWSFRALVVDAKAVSAKIATIKEE